MLGCVVTVARLPTVSCAHVDVIALPQVPVTLQRYTAEVNAFVINKQALVAPATSVNGPLQLEATSHW